MISRLLHLILVSVTLLLAPSCSEQSIQEAKLRRELHIPADMPIRDLGTVELLVNSPRVIDLGDGKVVTVTTYGITNDLLQISVAYTYKHQPLAGRKAQPYAHPRTNKITPDKQMVVEFCCDPAGQLALVMKPKLISR